MHLYVMFRVYTHSTIWLVQLVGCESQILHKNVIRVKTDPLPRVGADKSLASQTKGSLCLWLSRVSPPLPVSYASCFARAIAVASTLDESEPFMSGEPSSRCKYHSRAILAVLAACVTVWLLYVDSWYMCYLFVVKSICARNFCGLSQPQKYEQWKFPKLR